MKAVLSFVAGLAVGAGGVLAYVWSSVHISPVLSVEFNPMDLISIGITVWLALFVVNKLSRQDTEERAKKELFIKRFSNLEELIISRTRNISSTPHAVPSVSKIMKVLRSNLDKELSAAVRHGVIAEDDTTAQRLKTAMTELWQLLTDTPARGAAAAPSAEVRDGALVYTAIIEQIAEKVAIIRDLIVDLQIKINSARPL